LSAAALLGATSTRQDQLERLSYVAWPNDKRRTMPPRLKLHQQPEPPQVRHRALAELDAEIMHTEASCERWRQEAGALPSSQASRFAKAMLHLAEQRLKQLLRSRDVLLTDRLELDGEGSELS
jgi:hypothetical protein